MIFSNFYQLKKLPYDFCIACYQDGYNLYQVTIGVPFSKVSNKNSGNPKIGLPAYTMMYSRWQKSFDKCLKQYKNSKHPFFFSLLRASELTQ